MRAIDLHSEQREKQAKRALVETAKVVVGKYIVTQRLLNSVLSGGIISTSKKKGCCSIINTVDRLTRKMAKLEDQAGQIAKTYELMFGIQIDIKLITKEAFEKHYPLLADGYKKDAKNKATESLGNGVSFRKLEGDDIPEELRGLVESIKKGLGKIGGTNSVDVGVIEMGKDGTIFGLHPKDFENFNDFYKAVKKAGKKAGKGVLTEDMISSLIEGTDTKTTEETPSSEASAGNEDDGKAPVDPKSN